MATKSKSPRLGRGLSALMAQPVKVTPEPVQTAPSPATKIEPKTEPKANIKVEAETEAKSASNTSGKAGQSTSTAATAKNASRTQAQAAGKVDKASKNSTPTVTAASEPEQEPTGETGGITWLSPSMITPNPHQPRRLFDEAALARLAASIKEAGLMQPIIVRPAKPSTTQGAAGPTHELVAGERRWRAVQLAGLQTIPAIVRDLDENQSAEWALVENLQREDLNPMERAEAFSHLISQFNLSHEQIAQRVGVERSTISNLLRFMVLDKQVQDWVRQGRLSAGQARALAGVPDKSQQKALAQKVITQEMSVRAVEAAVRQLNQDDATNDESQPVKKQVRAAHLADLEQQISQQLETKVRIRPGRKKGSGTMSIDFYSVDQFDTLLKRLAVDAE